MTRKTVELHLGNAYGKLGIRSRKELPEALAPPSFVSLRTNALIRRDVRRDAGRSRYSLSGCAALALIGSSMIVLLLGAAPAHAADPRRRARPGHRGDLGTAAAPVADTVAKATPPVADTAAPVVHAVAKTAAPVVETAAPGSTRSRRRPRRSSTRSRRRRRRSSRPPNPSSGARHEGDRPGRGRAAPVSRRSSARTERPTAAPSPEAPATPGDAADPCRPPDAAHRRSPPTDRAVGVAPPSLAVPGAEPAAQPPRRAPASVRRARARPVPHAPASTATSQARVRHAAASAPAREHTARQQRAGR